MRQLSEDGSQSRRRLIRLLQLGTRQAEGGGETALHIQLEDRRRGPLAFLCTSNEADLAPAEKLECPLLCFLCRLIRRGTLEAPVAYFSQRHSLPPHGALGLALQLIIPAQAKASNGYYLGPRPSVVPVDSVPSCFKVLSRLPHSTPTPSNPEYGLHRATVSQELQSQTISIANITTCITSEQLVHRWFRNSMVVGKV